MKKTLLVMTMVIALAMSTMAGALAAEDQLQDGAAQILAPAPDTFVLADTVALSASYTGESTVLNWAARVTTCGTTGENKAAMGPNVTNVEDDIVSWSYTNGQFDAVLNVSQWDDGAYCFIFNPGSTTTERTFVTFYIAKEQRTKDACKDGGWMTFGDYKNQGQCVSEFARAK